MMASRSFNSSGEVKSWKKLNEERKAIKKERRQQKLIQSSEAAILLKEQAEKQKSAVPLAPKPIPSTISLAVPGSILENTQSLELRAYVAGQVARSAAIFRVNEIIVFDDICVATPREQVRINEDEENGKIVRRSSMQLARILQYLECPQYLRKFFFPMHKDLQYSGLLNPLDTPHHLRQQSVFRYREGVITDKAAKPGTSYANVGLLNDVMVDKPLTPGVRVTVRLENLKENSKKLRGSVVSPEEPRRETGVYWGYNVRIANCLSDIFSESPYKGGYDLMIGTSDRGKTVQSLQPLELSYNHLLIVFGGLRGLETALTNDDKLTEEDPSLLFDHYINVLPRQGSRTIRTEEALLITLSALQEKFNAKVPDVEEELIDEVLPTSTDTSNQMPRVMNKRPKFTKRENIKEFVEEEMQPRRSKNPFVSNKKEKRNEPFNNEVENQQTFSKINERNGNPKNAFKATKRRHDFDSNEKKPENFNTAEKSLDDDFEVVPTHANTFKKNDDVDLSRFD